MNIPKPVREARAPKPLRRSSKRIARGKRPRQKRKSGLAKLKDRLWELFRQYVYSTSWEPFVKVRCFTCDAPNLEGSNCQAGHFVNAGKSLAVRYAPDNVRPQCFRCNISLKGNGAEFAVRLLDQIGEPKFRVLLQRSRVIVSLKASDLHEMIAALERGGADYELYWEQTFGPRLDELVRG